MGELRRGTVKWFNDAKGYGFIEHESGADVFVHYSVIEQDGFKTLKDGEEVDYEIKEGDKGLHAQRVIRVNAPAARVQKDTQISQEPSLQISAQDIEVERDEGEVQAETVLTPESIEPASLESLEQ